MIKVKLLNSNTIITLEGDGPKSPIKSSSGLYFYNPNELLCAAIGSCGGKEIVRYCAQNKIDVEKFEIFAVDMVDSKIRYHINHPKDLNNEHKKELIRLVSNCPISELLNNNIEVILKENEKEPEIRKPSGGCCGN